VTTVNISGTFSEKQKANNGLTKVAGLIHDKRTSRVQIVGWVEFHSYTEKLTGEVLTVAVPVIESVLDADGKDTHGWGEAVMDMIDELRKERGLGAAAEVPFHSGELGGQIEFDFDGDGKVSVSEAEPETRLGPDGEHEVPPASAEEELAERAEAKAKRTKADRVAAEASATAAAAEVPAAEFSGQPDGGIQL
jgi:hypothetical protein